MIEHELSTQSWHAPPSGWPTMSLYEYSKWDGSQQFLPQSADKVFDQLSEYLLQYGEQVLRNLDELDDETCPKSSS